MPLRSVKIDSAWRKAALVLCGAVCILAAWYFTKWGMANSAAGRADDVEIAAYLTELAPDDPQTHYAAAVLLEKSFDPDDIRKTLKELETAVAVSPNNYLYWFELGRARERSGDADGAERALRRALALAPNYSRVQWALGNALLRQGRTDEAFEEIKKAVTGDASLADSAAATAWLFFDGDVGRIQRALSGSTRFEAAVAGVLIREKKFDEAMQIWSGLPADEKRTSLQETGKMLIGKLLAGKRFRDAVRVSEDISSGSGGPRSGHVTNGGFESPVRPDTAAIFEWQIAPGLQPQIVLSGAQKHGGNNSLFFVFNSSDAKDFRIVSQTIAVVPGEAYELEIFYRSDLKTSAEFKWEIVDAADGKQLAVTGPVANKAEWTALHIGFKVPPATDGITIRLARIGCNQICAVTGNLWFDDISLRPAGQ